MKFSSLVLLATLILMLLALFASNILLKKRYDKIDKSDIYWTYEKILQEPFKYIKINGGNVTNIAYEPHEHASVRVSENWSSDKKKLVKAYVKNDTLFLTFPNTYKDNYEKDWLKWFTLVRVFSPELLLVDGVDTDFKLFKLKQKSITVNLSGRSNLEIESYVSELDSIHITEKDSSNIVIEMSPDLKGSIPVHTPGIYAAPLSVHAESAGALSRESATGNVDSRSWETMYIKGVTADVQGASLLDIGHAQITSLKLNISDTSGILLSGFSLGRFKK